MHMWIAIVLVLSLVGAARAEIYEWRDSNGVRHFTNMKQLIPDAHREGASVFVDLPALPAGVGAPVPTDVEAETPQRQAPVVQVVFDQGAMEQAFESGVRQALESSAYAEANTGPVSVEINGPFVAAAAASAPYRYYPGGYPPPVLPYDPWGSSLVTSSFDQGRSRHRTLRMLMQDRFAAERGVDCNQPLFLGMPKRLLGVNPLAYCY